jgi:hypothetical protein
LSLVSLFASPQHLDIKFSCPGSDNQRLKKKKGSDNQNVVVLGDKTESSTQLVSKKDVPTQ